MMTRFTEGPRHWHPYGHGSCAQAQLSAGISGWLSLATTGASSARTSLPILTSDIAAAATHANPIRPAISLHMDICCFPQHSIKLLPPYYGAGTSLPDPKGGHDRAK